MKLGWYVRRLRRMSTAEVATRLRVAGQQRYWATPRRRPDGLATLQPGPRATRVALPRASAPTDTPAARASIAAADALLGGSWPIFHLDHAAIASPPNWFADPLTGATAPRHDYAFTIPYREEALVGNIKFVWELSRHQATTVLACAWWLTGEARYADGVADHLRSWWRDNPFLTGVHWVSGIEVGLRLLAWTSIRALLADWPGVQALFDDNPVFARQLYHHQRYIEAFHSRFSSANNHLIAELAGLAAAAVAFPWFAQSARWADWAQQALADQAVAQTHPDGFNREQASEYHVFVLEMLLAAAIVTHLAGRTPPAALDASVRRMADALAASLDDAGRPPRFGDGDEGRGLLLDAPGAGATAIVLDAARALHGAAPWWPDAGGSVLGHVAGLVGAAPPPRAVPRPDGFADAGVAILRTGRGGGELWVRCDGGPHGFLSIAAHGHADALSIEMRAGGVEILSDPGTYCYHGEPAWRAYFKGTPGHNTLTVDGADQAVGAGPFLWLTQPVTTITYCEAAADAPRQSWQASHDGYQRLADPVTHHRRVVLDRDGRRLGVEDWIVASQAHDVLLAWHLGPAVDVLLDDTTARLRWPGARATIALPPDLAWRVHRGEDNPPCGWHSAGFGQKTPAHTLTGRGRLAQGTVLLTRFAFPARPAPG